MTATQSLKLYQIANRYFKNEEDATAFVSEIEIVVDEKLESKKDIFLTKDDKIDLMEKMSKDKIDLIKWMVGIFITLALMIVGLYLKKP
jgi:hypothetical protein